jgi:short-subunit dehydrogenase
MMRCQELFLKNLRNFHMCNSKLKKIYKNPKTIFITGASSGIGKALAIAYAAPEITLFLCGRNESRLTETANLCKGKGAIAHTFLFDVTNREETENAIKQADAIKPIELLIANAGVSGGVLGMPETSDGTNRIIGTNVNGVVNTVLPTIAVFKERGCGQIAIIASLAGYRGMSSCPAYSASKACVKAWGEGLRGLLKKDSIAVNVVCPGFIETPLTDKNKFKMPFLMQADKAAEIIKRRLTKNSAIIAFPHIMAFGAWFGSALPSWIILPILGLFPKKES